MKTFWMVLALGSVFAAGTACFGLFFPREAPPAGTAVEACEGLAGEAKADCERRHAR
jgi:hypothetical protein